MDWNTLQQRWRQQPGTGPAPELTELLDSNEQLRRQVLRRDRLETWAAVAVAIAFALIAWHDASASNWLAAGSSLFVALWACWVPLRLRRSRLPEVPFDLPMRSHLQRQAAALREQARMLETVWLWYELPPTLGVIVYWLAVRGYPKALDWIFFAFTLLIGVSIIWLNRRVARDKFRTAADRVDEQLRHIAD